MATPFGWLPLLGSLKAKKRSQCVVRWVSPFVQIVLGVTTSMATPFEWLPLLGSPKAKKRPPVCGGAMGFRTDRKYGYPFWVATPSGWSQGKEASPSVWCDGFLTRTVCGGRMSNKYTSPGGCARPP